MHLVNDRSELDLSGSAVLKFWAVWCGPCKKMSPILEKLESEFPTTKFYSIDADTMPDIVADMGIKSLPTLLLYKDGQEMQRVVGLTMTEPLRQAIKVIEKE